MILENTEHKELHEKDTTKAHALVVIHQWQYKQSITLSYPNIKPAAAKPNFAIWSAKTLSLCCKGVCSVCASRSSYDECVSDDLDDNRFWYTYCHSSPIETIFPDCNDYHLKCMMMRYDPNKQKGDPCRILLTFATPCKILDPLKIIQSSIAFFLTWHDSPVAVDSSHRRLWLKGKRKRVFV